MSDLKVLREYEKNDMLITEYTVNGVDVIGSTMVPIGTVDVMDIPNIGASLEEQILAETQYKTALLEMNMMGGY